MRRWLLGGALCWAAASGQAQMAGFCARLDAARPVQAATAPAAVDQLQRRRDPRSLALADYLLAAASGPDGAAARARLQDRARSSTDPMLTVLALHLPCVQPGCRNIEASQWSRLEPANLLAWLALPRASSDGRYVLDQIAEHVRYSRSYRQEAAALFNGPPPAGLDLPSPWAVATLYGLAPVCRQLTDAVTAQRCDAVAEWLWADGGAAERLMALVLAQHAQPLLAQRRATWEPRRRELEAVSRWLGEDGGRASAQPVPTRADVCEALAPARPGERTPLSEWERARILLAASGLQLWELYPRRAMPGRPPS